jgi:putative two-component system protein, hydrogenase maturation factor HypX/HoxX
MRILLLTHSFNSLTQRLHVALRDAGHAVSVEFDIAESVTEEAVAAWQPELLIAPFLKRRIPESVWRHTMCWVVHPGIPGDQGPSALDWAVLRGEPDWGVTVLQATADFDAGPVWAHADFAMRDATKGDLYRQEVTDAAVAAVMEALSRWRPPARPVPDGPHSPPGPARRTGRWQPLLRQAERTIDWRRDDAATVLRKIRSADGQPGVLDALFGHRCRLFDAHPATDETLERARNAHAHAHAHAHAGAHERHPPPGAVLARRGPAVLRATADGRAVWIGHVRREDQALVGGAERPPLKLPATTAFAADCASLVELDVPLMRSAASPDRPAEYDELHYAEFGTPGQRIGWLAFDVYNGALSERQCRRLLQALQFAAGRDTAALVIVGGDGFFCNGIHLHEIEAAAQVDRDSAADASWRHIQAIDDVALALITMTDRLTVAALRGNAGAGGCFLALACDEVWAAPGVVLNPHYKNMGNLYGSEYWTYLLPRRLARLRGGDVGDVDAQVKAITQGRLPIGTREALELGLIDAVLPVSAGSLGSSSAGSACRLSHVNSSVMERVTALVADQNRAERVTAKQQQRRVHEAHKPLAAYREQELARMHRNFYGFDPSYHVARHHFVTRKPQAFTPRHLAVHRDPRRAASPSGSAA